LCYVFGTVRFNNIYRDPAVLVSRDPAVLVSYSAFARGQTGPVVCFIVMEDAGHHFDVSSGSEGSQRPSSGHTWL
jgi:hypothetical protein